MRAAYDPTYTADGRSNMPEHHIAIMKETIKALERRGETKAAIARSAGVDKVLVTRLFNRQLRSNGEPQAVSKAYAHKICQGILVHCRRRHVDTKPIEDILRFGL